MDDELVDMPPHAASAAISALFRRDERAREIAVMERSLTHPMVEDTLLPVSDMDRRGMFLSIVQKKVMAEGAAGAREYLRSVYHFSKGQASAIIREARIELVADMATVREELRALADARLEDIMKRARGACDLSNEIKALKEYMRLHGLFEVVDTGLGDFADLMRKVTAAADAQVIDAEFTVKEEEEEPSEPWAMPEKVIDAEADAA